MVVSTNNTGGRTPPPAQCNHEKNTLCDIVQRRSHHKVPSNPEIPTLPIVINGKHCGRVVQGQPSHKMPQSMLQRALTIFSNERRCKDVAQPMKSRKVSANVT